MATGTKQPVVGSDCILSEGRPLPLHCLPVEVGLRANAVEYTCIDASQQFLAVGSAQGYVWVVDLQSSRLLREFGEFKGCAAITEVKLNPVRDYVAYGTDNGFVRIERLSKVKLNKLRVQEKSGHSVSCMEWSQNGEDIFCGFNKGRLVQFTVKFKEGIMKHVPLHPEQYGSSVVQLSINKNLLLVSTLDRAFILDVGTNKLDQIGRKERKSGPYGGCFVENGQNLLIARPGLRIWIANELGKVLSTVAFKEVLSSQKLPTVAISSIPTSSICFSRLWQFTTLHPMLNGKFVVTFQENAVFVLDPLNGLTAGAAILKSGVKSISTSGGFLYILCGNNIVRVVVHHSLTTMYTETKKQCYISNQSTPCTSVTNSPIGSVENLLKTTDQEVVEELSKGVNRQVSSTATDDQSHDVITIIVSDSDGLNLPKSTEQDISALKGEPNQIADVQDPTITENQDADGTYTGFESIREHSRRVRMSQSAGDDVVANSKLHRKRKKGKGKKLSSATSSTSVSMERLVDIADVEYAQVSESSAELIEFQQSKTKTEDVAESKPTLESTMSSVQDSGDAYHTCPSSTNTFSGAGGEPVLSLQGVLGLSQDVAPGPLIRSPSNASCTQDEAASTAINNTSTVTPGIDILAESPPTLSSHSIAEDLIPNTTEDESILHCTHNVGSSIIQAADVPNNMAGGIQDSDVGLTNPSAIDLSTRSPEVIDNESGQKISNESLEPTPEDPSFDVAATPNLTTANSDPGISLNSNAACSKAGDGDSLCTAAVVCEISDNPLYQDTDEERSYGSQGVVERCVTESKARQQLLQPALTDPLHDEEILETGTTRPRHINFSEQLPASLYSSTYYNLPGHKVRSEVTSWIDVANNPFDASDSSHDSDPECRAATEVTNSQVVDDFYQLCGDLVKNTGDEKKSLSSVPCGQFSQASISDSHSLSHTSKFCEVQEPELSDQASEEQSKDIWVSVPFPSRNTLQCISLSNVLFWAVDSRGRVFYTTTSSRGENWHQIKKAMQQVASSPLGYVVWGVYHQNAYARLGIGMNPAGSMWKNITKNTSLAHKIKQLAVEENGVWAITVDNRVLFRKGVDEKNPEGMVWQEVSHGMNFSFIACCKNSVWALSSTGHVFIRDGITPSSPSGKKWTEIKSPRMSAVSITNDGVVWGINEEGSIGFRTGITPSKPGGRGPWWEVTLDSDLQALSPFNSLWQAMSADGSHLFSSAVSPFVSHQITTVSASSSGGVVVLEAGHKLHGCWKMATGYHYTPACKEGGFQLKVWSRMAAGGTGLWFVRDDGDLYCLSPGSKLKRVEVPSCVELIAASPNCMWVISKDMVWSRQGMTAELSEGISFDYIELSTLLHDKKLRSVACGKKVSWGIDSSGVPHFRFGVHAREPGTGMSPAWVPVEDHPGPLLQIAVCPDDWLVWACDEDHNVYVRSGVTVDFPVGRKWVRIPKQKIKELAATTDRMYGLTPSGKLVCRFGISENNVQGTSWRKMPGKYEHITTGAFGELWTLDNKGQVWKQEWKVIKVSDTNSNFAASMLADPESWEFV